MNSKKTFFTVDQAGCVLGTVLLLTLTGCVGYVEGPRAGVYVEPAVQVDAGFVGQDDYVYYPGYQMYYGSRSHQWYEREGSSWVAHPEPREVSADVLRSAASVKMDFHDSPANHHAAVVQKYPKNWAPSGSHQGQKPNQKDDQHGENNGR
ncbi:MAG: hypothetical protein ABSF51_09000 [Verrucomicrobiota bacterium]|jgi:hypothetical protein